jgi:hypothetical protein
MILLSSLGTKSNKVMMMLDGNEHEQIVVLDEANVTGGFERDIQVHSLHFRSRIATAFYQCLNLCTVKSIVFLFTHDLHIVGFGTLLHTVGKTTYQALCPPIVLLLVWTPF